MQHHFKSSFQGRRDTLPHGTSTWIVRGVLISEIFKSSTERNAAFISSVIGASGSGARWVPRWAPPQEAKAGSPGTFCVCGLRGPPVPVGDSEEGKQPPRLRDRLHPALLTSEGCQALEWSCSLSSLQAGLGWDSPCVVMPSSSSPVQGLCVLLCQGRASLSPWAAVYG